ncbi:MAG: lipase family protein [Dokdonella sp.]|uniref:esterase/lipase family protein n=1 Tax=Dokdonella sp. TaxID=2291710 RepID=UPI0032666058
MNDHVILLHGIWMRGITLLPLARRLRAAGYTVETIDYASVFRGIAPAVQRLRERMLASDAPAVHLVGHSLGSLVALEAARESGGLPQGRIVCLGPPLLGSAVARGLAAIPGGKILLGHSADPLLAGVRPWIDSRRVGVVAGRLPFGIGAAIGALAAPHDGTVSVAETQLEGIADHRTVDTSHTGLLFSTEVVELTVGFLRDGCFSERAA